jgi:D-serine deaminase-like pyridoxal phosphate-dependent protein
MRRNISRLNEKLAGLGVALRPHLKTCKSIDIARLLMPGNAGPATVSTLREAEYFATGGVRDLTYAVGISPDKFARVAALRSWGVDLGIILDSLDQARALGDYVAKFHDRIPALIEIDSDSHRSGVAPDASDLLEIGRQIDASGAEVRGVLTHAGGSYGANSEAALQRAAEEERAAVVLAASRLREAGLSCPVVSVGSTPTAFSASNLAGVTEVRAGVFVFFDLVMAGIGICAISDIALSVMATVTGHQKDRGWIIVDAGWTALSRDRGTARQAIDQGYGVVCDVNGQVIEDLIVTETNQEHGILAIRPGSHAGLPTLPVGTRVRLLPNHACATAAQHDGYHVLSNDGARVTAYWPRVRGW